MAGQEAVRAMLRAGNDSDEPHPREMTRTSFTHWQSLGRFSRTGNHADELHALAMTRTSFTTGNDTDELHPLAISAEPRPLASTIRASFTP